MALADQFRQTLADGDVRGMRRLWSQVAPHLPPITSDADGEIVLHRARTEAISLPFSARAYSHRWLTERNLASGLPDDLRPKAERLYPSVVEVVGVAVMSSSPELRPAAREVERAMLAKAGEMQGDGVTDPAVIRAGMLEARRRVRTQLFGSTRIGALS